MVWKLYAQSTFQSQTSHLPCTNPLSYLFTLSQVVFLPVFLFLTLIYICWSLDSPSTLVHSKHGISQFSLCLDRENKLFPEKSVSLNQIKLCGPLKSHLEGSALRSVGCTKSFLICLLLVESALLENTGFALLLCKKL